MSDVIKVQCEAIEAVPVDTPEGFSFLEAFAKADTMIKQAQAAATAAQTASTTAGQQAINAATSASNASTSATSASASEAKAKEYMEEAFSGTPDGYQELVDTRLFVDSDGFICLKE